MSNRPGWSATRGLWLGTRGLLWAVVGLTLVGCGPTSFLITPVPTQQRLKETVVARESIWANDRVAIVDVDGTLTNTRAGQLFGGPGENPTARFKEKLDLAASDQRVKAVVLRVNSPGGTVTASDLMYYELRKFKQRTGKPVVTCMMDVAASGGYYIACATDYIIAHPTTITGSIGVIVMMPNISGTLAKIGAEVYTFKSGALKDSGSPFREMNADDRVVFDEMVASMYARFRRIVEQARPDTADRLDELANGRVFTGEAAHAAGLVDQLGTLSDAIVKAKQLAGIAERKVVIVQYAPGYSYRQNVYASADHDVNYDVQVGQARDWQVLLPETLRSSTPQALYLWAPGW